MKNLFDSYNYRSFCKNSMVGVVVAFLAGCSTMPAGLNPVEWYKGARDAIVGGDAQKEEKSNQSDGKVFAKKTNGDFPKLSSVPARPKALSRENRKSITSGLVADNDASRKYSKEKLGRQSKSSGISENSQLKTEPATMPRKEGKINSERAVSTSMQSAKVKPKLSGSYLVPPSPVRLNSFKNKTKLIEKKVKAQRLSKQIESSKQKLKKLPKFNPNPPRIGVVPGSDNNTSNQGVTVISGSGVQMIKFTERLDRKGYILPPSSLNISRTNLTEQIGKNRRQKSYQVATILFSNGSSRVGRVDRRVLRQVVSEYKKVGGRLRIVGHASRRTGTNDPVLHKMTNFQVSASRAERVARELVKMGVKANKLSVGSVSDHEPRYYEYMPSGEAGNRRAEIFIDLL